MKLREKYTYMRRIQTSSEFLKLTLIKIIVVDPLNVRFMSSAIFNYHLILSNYKLHNNDIKL